MLVAWPTVYRLVVTCEEVTQAQLIANAMEEVRGMGKPYYDFNLKTTPTVKGCTVSVWVDDTNGSLRNIIRFANGADYAGIEHHGGRVVHIVRKSWLMAWRHSA